MSEGSSRKTQSPFVRRLSPEKLPRKTSGRHPTEVARAGTLVAELFRVYRVKEAFAPEVTRTANMKVNSSELCETLRVEIFPPTVIRTDLVEDFSIISRSIFEGNHHPDLF